MLKYSSVSKSNYRPDIDGLRGFAVLSVLFFHLGISQFSGGYVGVDIFFVISGFLITKLIKEELDTTGSFNFKNFYIRRIRRLFPALFVTLALTTVFSTLLLSPGHLQRFGGALTSALMSFSNIYFWFEADYFDVSAQVKPLLHTWSLSIEEQFYMIWPISMFLIYRKNRKWATWFVLFLVAGLSLYLNLKFSDGSVAVISKYSATLASWIADGRTTIFFLMPFRVFEFIIGAAIVWLINYRIHNKFIQEFLFLLGISLILYSVFSFNDKLLFPSYYALAPCIGTALLIYSGTNSFFSILLTNRISVGVGLISYSLYLFHWPIIVFWSYIKADVTFIDQMIIVALSFFMAHLNYSFIEYPFRHQKIVLNNMALKVSCLFAILLIATLGIHMKQNGGWFWRITTSVSFENVGETSEFKKQFNGGTGYPMYGPINTEKPPNIVMMGDSHGRHYMEGLYKEWAEPEGVALYSASGISFLHLPSFTRITKGVDWNSLCPNKLDIGLSYIKKGKQTTPPIVILSHSWIDQMAIADLLDQQGNRRHIKVDVEDIIRGISALKQRIGDSPLVVIGMVPTSDGVNLYDIFTRPRTPFLSDFNPEEYLTSPVNEKYLRFNQRLSEAAQSTGEFIFLDPHDALCENGSCRNTDDQNHLIYSDTSHLSTYGSREVIKAFLPQLKEIAQRQFVLSDNSTFPNEVLAN